MKTIQDAYVAGVKLAVQRHAAARKEDHVIGNETLRRILGGVAGGVGGGVYGGVAGALTGTGRPGAIIGTGAGLLGGGIGGAMNPGVGGALGGSLLANTVAVELMNRLGMPKDSTGAKALRMLINYPAMAAAGYGGYKLLS